MVFVEDKEKNVVLVQRGITKEDTVDRYEKVKEIWCLQVKRKVYDVWIWEK